MLLSDNVLRLRGVYLLFYLAKIEMRDSVFTIEDLRNLLESWSFRLDVDEVHEDELKSVPKLF